MEHTIYAYVQMERDVLSHSYVQIIHNFIYVIIIPILKTKTANLVFEYYGPVYNFNLFFNVSTIKTKVY